MRRIVLGAAAAALLVVAAVAFGAGGSVTHATLPPPPALKPSAEKTVSEREPGQELRGYWGKLAPLSGNPEPSGYYQAKCVWLKGTTDGRILCDIVVNLGNGSTGGTLTLQGLVKRPTQGLLADASDIQLAVTGGGGGYSGKRGSAEIRGTTGGLVISLTP